MDGPYAQGEQGQTSHLKPRACKPRTSRIRRQTTSIVFQASGGHLASIWRDFTDILRAFTGKHSASESLFVVILGLTSVMLYGRTLILISSRLIGISASFAYSLFGDNPPS